MSEIAKNGISRRGFLTGAAGMGALAALGLAGCGGSPKSAKDKPADAAASSAAAGSADWLGSAPEIAKGDIKETVDTDILVVGAGMSGIVAGATLADLGAKFEIIDKGGDVADSHYDIGAIHSRWQKEQGIDFDEGRWLNEWTRYASFKNDQSVARTWVENSGATVEWLVDLYNNFLGEPVDATVDVENGSDGRAGGTNYFIPPECHHIVRTASSDPRKARVDHVAELTKFIESKGGKVTYSTALVKLVQDESGKVTGAIAKNSNGYVQYNTSKGVILAAGGYAANPDMLKARDPEAVKCITSLNYNQNNDGSGIKAALWAGAMMDPVGATMVFDRGVVAPGVDAGYSDEKKGTWPTNGQFNLGSQPFLKVDRHGKRISNESANYDACCFAAASHPGGVWCQVFDVNAPNDVQIFKTQGCSAMTWQMQLKDKTVDEAYDEKYISKGLMMKADTLDELATKLGFEGDDKAAFLKTVEGYNALYDAGADTQFGKEAYRLSAIRQAPFYGAWYGGSLLTTLDGVRINSNTQAVGEDGNPIEGLCVVGTNSGSYYAGNYPVYLVGNCLGRQVTFGRYAARFLAGDVK
ncbi:FAD-dependent oxidoreductase [Curtanaerobium respiraculi]|uniref:FAD-dependent oxidoreductase n=1 Tax=Curtanaerobium respiraculi TaxID=2949669 RepID=UPI0024B38694|nr:FAD-binding protein [Curtanaerobium respiraculi]